MENDQIYDYHHFLYKIFYITNVIYPIIDLIISFIKTIYINYLYNVIY